MNWNEFYLRYRRDGGVKYTQKCQSHTHTHSLRSIKWWKSHLKIGFRSKWHNAHHWVCACTKRFPYITGPAPNASCSKHTHFGHLISGILNIFICTHTHTSTCPLRFDEKLFPLNTFENWSASYWTDRIGRSKQRVTAFTNTTEYSTTVFSAPENFSSLFQFQ